MADSPDDRLFHALWGEATVMYDRRKAPTRRALWRGGRRDSDWLTRPPGALDRLEKRRRKTLRLRNVLMSFW